MHILCLGDVVGRPGRQVLKEMLQELRRRFELSLVIANGENAAGGIGLTPETARELFRAGVDVITTGNHVWKHRELYPFLEKEPRIIRPYNYGSGVPGKGSYALTLECGTRIEVINLLGRVYMEPVNCPFAAMTTFLATAVPGVRIVDFHAEATSEKRAMGHFLDGSVTAVFGTHTHVQTADAFILPKGTATLTDLGMCGVEGASVLGMKKEPVLERFVTSLPCAFKPATGVATINGALLEVDEVSAKALSLRLVRGNSDVLHVI